MKITKVSQSKVKQALFFRIFFLALLALFLVVMIFNAPWTRWFDRSEDAFSQKRDPECQPQENRLACYSRFYDALTEKAGVFAAIGDVKQRYQTSDPTVTSECHQILHTIGRKSALLYPDISEAYAKGDAFCWSGYYHGVVESFVKKGGKKVLAEGTGLDEICRPLKEARPYSFDHYNCVHGLGHGIMAVKYNELFDSLKICDHLADEWDRKSCWSGAFMENLMANGDDHKTKYLKADDPIYPCNAVEPAYQGQCYLMQTSYMLKIRNNDFKMVFALCDSVGDSGNTENELICYQSLGRDASSQTVSDPTRTRDICLLGQNDEQRENCATGAVKDFISYFHSDGKAKEFCALLPGTLPASCLKTAQEYYKIF